MRYYIIIFFIFYSFSLFGQSVSDLNSEKDKLQDVINENNKLLSQYNDKKDSELLLISVVDEKISQRQRLINIYNNELFAYNKQIMTISNQLDSLDVVISNIKSDYSKIILQQYKNNSSVNSFAFIFSASSFNESYRRFLFLRQYNDYRKQQVSNLLSSQAKFDSLKLVISNKQESLKTLINNIEVETNKLNKELTFRKSNVSYLNMKVSDLSAQIAKDQKSMSELENKILALIREEASKLKNSKVLSSDILKNKGILPWPCRKFVVVSVFGEHEHPIIPSILINNNGIDIEVVDDNNVYPIHEGIVSRIIMIPGSNASVIVRHGTILTVYSNLSEVFVKKNQSVSSSTSLGKVFSGVGINSNVLHFELWNGEEKQNPSDWLEIF